MTQFMQPIHPKGRQKGEDYDQMNKKYNRRQQAN